MYVIKDKKKNKYVKTNAEKYPDECAKHVAHIYKTVAGARKRRDYLNSKSGIGGSYGCPSNNFVIVNYKNDDEIL